MEAGATTSDAAEGNAKAGIEVSQRIRMIAIAEEVDEIEVCLCLSSTAYPGAEISFAGLFSVTQVSVLVCSAFFFFC